MYLFVHWWFWGVSKPPLNFPDQSASKCPDWFLSCSWLWFTVFGCQSMESFLFLYRLAQPFLVPDRAVQQRHLRQKKTVALAPPYGPVAT